MTAIRTFLLTFALARVSAADEAVGGSWNKPSRVFDTGAHRVEWDEKVFDVGDHRIEWDETVFDIGPHRIEWDETVFDVGPHRIVWDETVFEKASKPFITTAPTESPVARTFEVIFAETFDNDMGDYFIDGDGDSGGMVKFNTNFAHGGTGQSVRIKDNADVSELYTKDIDVSSYTEIMVSFWYESKGVSSDGGFYFETKTAGGDWVKLEDFVRGVEWQDNQADFTEGLVEFSVADTDVLAIKFSGYKLGSTDYIFIDDVTVSGK
jgi:hypothetical protein